MKTAVIGFFAGITGGVVGALCGVGGGIVMVPAFTMFLGIPQREAVATSLAVIVVLSLLASFQYARSDLIQWPVFWFTALGAGIAAVVASDYLEKLSNLTLTRVFAIVLIVFGVIKLIETFRSTGASE
jgi:uncharacterized membrane protein YfcA